MSACNQRHSCETCQDKDYRGFKECPHNYERFKCRACGTVYPDSFSATIETTVPRIVYFGVVLSEELAEMFAEY